MGLLVAVLVALVAASGRRAPGKRCLALLCALTACAAPQVADPVEVDPCAENPLGLARERSVALPSCTPWECEQAAGHRDYLAACTRPAETVRCWITIAPAGAEHVTVGVAVRNGLSGAILVPTGGQGAPRLLDYSDFPVELMLSIRARPPPEVFPEMRSSHARPPDFGQRRFQTVPAGSSLRLKYRLRKPAPAAIFVAARIAYYPVESARGDADVPRDEKGVARLDLAPDAALVRLEQLCLPRPARVSSLPPRNQGPEAAP